MNILTEVKRVHNLLEGMTVPESPEECKRVIGELGEIKEDLINKGFNVSFAPSIANLKDLSKSEIAEIKKQLREFRYINYLKKNTLRRIDYAIASYKIAEIALKTDSFRSIVNILPYNGDLIGKISKGGFYAAKTYFNLYELLKGEQSQRGISVEILVPSEEGIKRQRIQLYKTRDIAKYVHDNFGANAQIVKTKIITKHRSILANRALRKVIATVYALKGKEASEKIPIETEEKVEKYHQILKKYGIPELIRVDASISQLDEKMLDEMYKEGFIEYGENNSIILNEELGLELSVMVNKISWNTIKEAYRAFLRDLMEYYIKTTKSQRKALGAFVFDDDIELLKPIAEKAGILGIVKPFEMVKTKAQLEEQGFTDPKYGYALFAYYQGWERLKKVFGVEESSIREEYKLIKELMENRGDNSRADEFLRNLRD